MIIEQNDFLASSGYRVIALALKHEKDFIRKNSYDNLELEDLILAAPEIIKMNGKKITFDGQNISSDIYGFGCGGFPIIVKGQGIVGAVAVSGLPDPADHLYVVEALEKMLGVEAPKIPAEVDENWIN